MQNLTLLVLKRNMKLYLRIISFSFFYLVILSLFALGYSIYEKSALTATNFGIEDYSAVGELTSAFSSNNISKLYRSCSNWQEYRSDFDSVVEEENFFLIFEVDFNESSLLFGINLLNNSLNLKQAELNENQIDFFNSELNLSSFLTKDSLPFDLDIIINLDILNNSLPDDFLISPFVSQLAYSVNLNLKKISSYKHLTRTLTKIDERFYSFVIETDIVSLSSIDSAIIEAEWEDSFSIPFKSIFQLFIIISLLFSSWLADSFINSYYNSIHNLLELLNNRGFNKNEHFKIIKLLPTIADTCGFLLLVAAYCTFSFVFKIDLAYAIFTAGIGYSYLVYRRIKFRPYSEEVSGKIDSLSLAIYILTLLLISVVPSIVNKLFYAVIPSWILTFGNTISSVIQYYIIGFFLSELVIFLFKKKIETKEKNNLLRSVNDLFKKSLITKRRILSSWFRSSVLIFWATIIIFSSVQTFNANYAINQEIAYPTDVVIEVNLPLANITQLEKLEEIDFVVPISQSTEKYFIKYNLYLVNFTSLELYFPDYCNLAKIGELKEDFSYVHKSLARELDFSEEDLFPIKFGKNRTDIIVNQPIRITSYFPLIKATDDAPFVVSNYREEYENYTIVNKLLINFKNGVDQDNALTHIKNTLNCELTIEEKPVSYPYHTFLTIFQYFFLLIVLFVGNLNFWQLKQNLLDISKKIILRGEKTKNVKKIFANNAIYFLTLSSVISLLLSLPFLLQTRFTTYLISLFVPVKIRVSLTIFLILLFPFTCIFTIYSTEFIKK